MKTSFSCRCIALFFFLFCTAWLPSAHAADAPAEPVITPVQANQVLEILRDDARRAELERTLSVIAEAAGRQAPATEAAPPAPVALEKDGVIAQTFAQAGNWMDTAVAELRLTASTLLQLRSARSWWRDYVGTPEAREATLLGIGTILLILAVALGVEALVARLLKRARSRLVAFAEQRRLQEGTGPSADAGGATSGSEAVTRVRHLSVLRRVPYAMAYMLLTLVPLAGFLAATTLLAPIFGGPAAGFYPFILPLAGAYLATRLAMAALRLLVSPVSPALRLSRLGGDSARYLDKWLRRLVIVAAFGAAAAEIVQLLGAAPDVRHVLTKLVGLILHGMLIVMVVQRRAQVARWLRGEKTGGIRAALADAWAPTAIAIIAGLWVVWALGAAASFSQLLQYVWRTALVMLLASLISMLLLGAIDRLFYGGAPGAGEEAPGERPYQALAQHTVLAVLFAVTIIALLEVWGIHALGWFEAGTVGRRLASAAATIAVACGLALLAWEAVTVSINRRIERWAAAGDLMRAARLRTLVPILRATLFIVIAMIVLLTALNELGINIAPLLAGASIIGVAIGFGSQKLVQDFITGIFLLMEDAMQVGDFVSLAGVSGTVENLSIRTVRLRAGDGSLHVVPFSSVSTVSNTNRGIGNASIRVSVTADSDLDTVIAAIRAVGEEMRNDPNLGPLMLADLDLWGVDQVDGASITLAGQIRALDRGRWTVQRAFNQRIYRRFRELGIQLTNPQASFVQRLEEPEAPAKADGTSSSPPLGDAG
ncbi:MAG: mechanosensitive ion channel [Pigmentiphaga sp.]|uniref:mechanosensitive ion channel domain-containing protein n=1 Tax=Pigmentiphaga sp. TaxID=1977564 RepID=UPI0029B7272D|nr:mechanosensitive ion channel domain-containing protein [Pigmentiphaga sp.]MDX3904600.1 mechanosensitive ion channel [Pigmentiphaga sp.]